MGLIDLFAAAAPKIDTSVLPHVDADPDRLQVLLTTLFSILAAASLLVIVIAGQRYTHSDGDPGAMSKAKNTVLFASIGLIVSISAVAIVSFILGNI